MRFHIKPNKGIGQSFFCMAAPGTLLGLLLGSVSPVSDCPEGRAVPPDLPADAGGVSAQGFCDKVHTFPSFPANGNLFPLSEGEVGIIFFMICDTLNHNGITPVDECVVTNILKGFAVFFSPPWRTTGLSVALQD
jgi:hypothetical protein